MKPADVMRNAVSWAYCPCLGPKFCGERIVHVQRVTDDPGHALCDPCMCRLARSLLASALDDAARVDEAFRDRE